MITFGNCEFYVGNHEICPWYVDSGKVAPLHVIHNFQSIYSACLVTGHYYFHLCVKFAANYKLVLCVNGILYFLL